MSEGSPVYQAFCESGRLGLWDAQSGTLCGALDSGSGDPSAGVLHREVSPAYREVFGLSVDPAEMTQPVNKPGLPIATA